MIIGRKSKNAINKTAIDDKVVNSDNANQDTINKNSSSRKSGKRQLAIGLAVVAMLVLIAAAIYAQIDKKDQVSKKSAVCDDALLEKASTVLHTDRIKELEPIAKEVEKLPSYDSDPNCLNIVTTYYVHTSDYKNAKTNYDKLVLVYDEKAGYNPKLGYNAIPVATLKTNIDFLEDQYRRIFEGNFIPQGPRADQQ